MVPQVPATVKVTLNVDEVRVTHVKVIEVRPTLNLSAGVIEHSDEIEFIPAPT